MDSLDDTIGRTHSLSLWLASESRSLLDLYAEVQGLREPPPPPLLPLSSPPPGQGRGRARRLRRCHGQCRRLAALLGRLLEGQVEAGGGAHPRLHRGLQLALTGLRGLDANLGLILASLGPAEEEEGEEEGAEEEGTREEEDAPDGSSRWEAKVRGYHLIAHYGQWLGRTVGELQQLKEGRKAESSDPSRSREGRGEVSEPSDLDRNVWDHF